MINKVILIGNVGADPEIRTLEGGVKVARIRLATTERIYNRQTQEAKDHTEWHSITLWRNMADVADRFIRKGSQIYVEGKLRSREWADANGQKRYGIEIVADDLKMLGRRPEGAGTPADGTSYGGGSQGGGTSGGAYGGSQGGSQGGGSYGSAPRNGGNYAPPAADPQPVNSSDEIDDLPF